MNDYKGSVAQQDVNVSTIVKKTLTLGGNYYEAALYVTNRFSSFGSDTPEYPVVTKNTYAAIIDDYAYLTSAEKAVIKNNLASLFAYASDITVYIIPHTEIKKYQMRAYFTYLDLEWHTTKEGSSDYVLSANSSTMLTEIAANGIDSDFTALLTDVPVDPTKVSGTSTATTKATINLLSAISVDIAAFARPALPTGAEGTVNAYLDAEGVAIGYSPALYQLGKSVSSLNDSGTPVGSSFDMDAMTQQNVLPTADVDTETLEGANDIFAAFFSEVNVNYFKPVGNGTGDLTNYGGWTLKSNCIGAQWIVAWMNYMNRVACANVLTSGKAIKNAATYSNLLNCIVQNASKMAKSGRLSEFKLSAPAFTQLPPTNGKTITIPNAWSATYLDNVRKVNITGTMTVAA